MFIFHGMNLNRIRLLLAFLLIFPATCTATIVRMQTSAGAIDVVLYDDEAPLTVANFLSYVESGAYEHTFFHRNQSGSVLYAGKYVWDGLINPVKAIVTTLPVANEFSKSNISGTLAMAKDNDNPDSATSQFFFNVTNNSKGSLKFDSTNGGYTVFGKVLDKHLPLVDAIAGKSIENAGGDFTTLPFVGPMTDRSLRESNLVMINDISSNKVSMFGNPSDRIFAYLEKEYPEFLAPANRLDAVSSTSNGYYYRCYADTKSCIGTSNGEMFYLDLNTGNLINLGSVQNFLILAFNDGYSFSPSQ